MDHDSSAQKGACLMISEIMNLPYFAPVEVKIDNTPHLKQRRMKYGEMR
jgi:hypothetical protein